MKGPKISVIIPVYNVSEYISRCADSIISQNLFDIEIIFVNDGTKDNSREIVQKYQHDDSRIMILDKENGGLSSARNYGLKYAKGEYVLFVDSDDYLERNACERIYIAHLENNADIIVFGAKVFPEYNVDEWVRNNLSVRTVYYDKNIPKVLFWEKGSYPYVWRNCYKRAFLEKIDILFDEEVKFAEDIVFQFQVFPFAENIAFIEDKLYNYRISRPGSLMNTYNKNEEEKLNYHILIAKKISEYWVANNLIEGNEVEYLHWIREYLLDKLFWWNCAYKGEKAKEISELIERCGLNVYIDDLGDYDRQQFSKLKKWLKRYK